jgi:hypothetical protein
VIVVRLRNLNRPGNLPTPAVRFKEPLYDNYVPPSVAVRQKSDQTKKPAQPAAAKGSNTARVKAATYDGTSS